MIIIGIVRGFLTFIMWTLAPFNLPNMPESAFDYIEVFKEYIVVGSKILANYTHWEYLVTLFGIVVLVDVGIKIYHLVIWIIRKLPIASE